MITTREAELLETLRREGPMSRQDLHRRTGLRPNAVGELADRMLRAGLLREGTTRTTGPGRPAVPLEIDPTQRRVLGIALEPKRVTSTLLNLCGQRVGSTIEHEVETSGIVATAAQVARQVDRRSTLAIGVSVTGFIEKAARNLLLSSVTPGHQAVSLQPLFDAAGRIALLTANDLQALALQWSLSHQNDPAQDVLLVYLRDGAMGAAILIGGRPTDGCITGGNELGHTRFPVDTEPCFCGQSGCLERICSTAFYKAQADRQTRGTLGEAAAQFVDHDPALERVIDLISHGIANALNFLRPHRLILASAFNGCHPFTNRLISETRRKMLPALSDRVRVDLWDQPSVDFAEAAAWLALARVYQPIEG